MKLMGTNGTDALVPARRRITTSEHRGYAAGGTTLRTMKRLLVLGFVAALGAAACTTATQPEASVPAGAGTLQQGGASGPSGSDPAPDFSVPTMAGGTFSLTEHLETDGRPVFLNLWASWCFPCREEMPAINESSSRHPGIKFVGVAVQDSANAAADFAAEIGVTYELGFDEDDAVDDRYSPLGLPASYIISADGLILERIFGGVTVEMLDGKFASWFG